MILTVIYFGYENGFNTIKPFQTKNAAIHEIASGFTKLPSMRFNGYMKFYSKFFD